MQVINVFDNNNKELEVHEDERGIIADVFYNSNINHVAIITSVPNSLRGNHYHRKSTQHMLITKGKLKYWYKDLDSNDPAEYVIVYKGDLVTTPPYEIHALQYLDKQTEFVVFTEGPRGGKDYELDTVRTANIVKL